ncbi:putative transcription initiation factor TFIID subunit 13 [Paratrimastix pyriformis]|uniref:Transcription initiation factor TFIID subunit 13 n=1 Tax=Paratrimastix pyriformis TaxID=342808 RepID=A0ABQ8UGC0_9EUKA|nr:putative transcription initiation factor TFIID subunit 13 [Paratrimastix pyriformis]
MLHYGKVPLPCAEQSLPDQLMYSLGDDRPLYSTASVIEDYVLQYVAQMTQRAAQFRQDNQLGVEELALLAKRDPKKNIRVQELLRVPDEIKEARLLFPEADIARRNATE